MAERSLLVKGYKSVRNKDEQSIIATLLSINSFPQTDLNSIPYFSYN